MAIGAIDYGYRCYRLWLSVVPSMATGSMGRGSPHALQRHLAKNIDIKQYNAVSTYFWVFAHF